MKLEHIAIWANDINKLKEFYLTYFDCTASEVYRNNTKSYTSYFISFAKGEARIELMHRPDILENLESRGFSKGLAHIAISVGEKDIVNNLTERLRSDGYTILGEPRLTGDGYYESIVLDPEGNLVEITD